MNFWCTMAFRPCNFDSKYYTLCWRTVYNMYFLEVKRSNIKKIKLLFLESKMLSTYFRWYQSVNRRPMSKVRHARELYLERTSDFSVWQLFWKCCYQVTWDQKTAHVPPTILLEDGQALGSCLGEKIHGNLWTP